MTNGLSTLAASVLALVGLCSAAAQAQPAAEFYKGKTIAMVVSSSAGGGYDVLSRTVARYLPRHIPGAPIIAVRNMPGAGGIVATNYLYNVASKDGLTIGGVQNNTPFEPLLGTKEAEYDPSGAPHGSSGECRKVVGEILAVFPNGKLARRAAGRDGVDNDTMDE